MVISKRTLIEQMIEELEVALRTSNQEQQKQRIASVKTLCKVILSAAEVEQDQGGHTKISKHELKAMLGQQKDSTNKRHDDVSSDSIFDF